MLKPPDKFEHLRKNQTRPPYRAAALRNDRSLKSHSVFLTVFVDRRLVSRCQFTTPLITLQPLHDGLGQQPDETTQDIIVASVASCRILSSQWH